MPWSRQACRFAVLIVLVLQATCLEARTWTAEKALHDPLRQAVESLMPDAAAAAILFNTAETASSDAALTFPAAAAAAVTASEILSMHTKHGLALPSQHQQQLQLTKPEAEYNAAPGDAPRDKFAAFPFDESSDELMEEYVYLEEPESTYEDDKLPAKALLPLPPQLPEDIYSSGSSSSSDVAAAAAPSMFELQGDVMISSRVPISSVLLQQSIAQPVIEMATDMAWGVWQVLSGFEGTVGFSGQRGSKFQLQELEVTVESGSSADLAAADRAVETSSSSSSGGSSSSGDVEISVTVESSRPRPLLSLLRGVNRKQQAVQDSLDAAAITAAVLKALGMKGSGEQQQQQQAVPEEKVQEMIAELQAKGTYEGRLTGSLQQLPATTAAAVAAAARALSSSEQWDSMQMELSVTHTVSSRAQTWLHCTLLVLAMVLAHMGLFLLLAPWVSKLMGYESEDEDDSSSSSSSSSKKQQQFISAGLAEKLLPEGAEAC